VRRGADLPRLRRALVLNESRGAVPLPGLAATSGCRRAARQPLPRAPGSG
jgi:hypothetical protein